MAVGRRRPYEGRIRGTDQREETGIGLVLTVGETTVYFCSDPDAPGPTHNIEADIGIPHWQ